MRTSLDVIATLDAERAFGWTRTTLLISGLYNNRSTFSDRIIGDIQMVSSIDADGATRLYEAWVERAFDGKWRRRVAARRADLPSG